MLLLCASASGGVTRSVQDPVPAKNPVWTGVSAASEISMVGCQEEGVIVEVAVVGAQRGITTATFTRQGSQPGRFKPRHCNAAPIICYEATGLTRYRRAFGGAHSEHRQ